MNSPNEQFSEIYDQYINKIYRFVYLKVNSQEIAEDLCSKVFLKGFEAYKAQYPTLHPHTKVSAETSGVGASTQHPIKNPGAFLYQIARNIVIDYYREKGRTKIISADSSPQLADPGTGPHDRAVLSADINIVKTAIQKLKKDYQDIIIWHYLDDMPIADIAKNLNKPTGTIRVMLHRGLKDLKDLIKES